MNYLGLNLLPNWISSLAITKCACIQMILRRQLLELITCTMSCQSCRLDSTPSTFQSLMNEVFRDYLKKIVLVFFDEILIYNKRWDDHLKHLRKVFALLQAHKFHVQIEKCRSGRQQVHYLRHLISNQGVAVDPSKVQEMVPWPKPKDLKSLRGFFGAHWLLQ